MFFFLFLVLQLNDQLSFLPTRTMKSLIRSLIRRQRKAIDHCSELIHPTTLVGLPVEILLSVFDFLSRVDLICFSFCSHRTRALSLKQIALLPRTNGDWLSVLTRLERDSPEHFACTICKHLHLYDGSESFGLAGFPQGKDCRLPCTRGLLRQWPSLIARTHTFMGYSPNQLSFLQLKLAMGRFRYGPKAGVSTDSLFYTQVRHFLARLYFRDMTTLFSREAQICPEHPSLYIRMQDIVGVNRRRDLECNRAFVHSREATPMENLEICRHKSLDFPLVVDAKPLHTEKGTSYVYTCPKCNTDSHIELRPFGSKIAAIMTRWVNLGPGLTEEDLSWTAHVRLTSSYRGRLDKDGLESLPATHSPRSCFETTSRQSFEDLQSRNLSYLANQQYRHFMAFIRPNLWHISYEEPSNEI